MNNSEKNKSRLLTKDEVELRVGQMSEDKSRATLLLYKNARVDMALLDERFGPENWECDYKELKGNLYCGVGVRYTEGGPLVWKWDCGTESNTEAEKGEASDAFKRACVRHGQGRELYTAPKNIWVEVPQGGIYRDTFDITELDYTDGRISTLTIVEHKTGAVVYSMGRKTGSRAASSDKPIINTTGSDKPVGTTEKPVARKRTVTLADCEKGKAVNLVADLARCNHDDLPEWEAGKGAIKYRKNENGDIVAELTIEPEAMDWIEKEAISYRKSLGK